MNISNYKLLQYNCDLLNKTMSFIYGHGGADYKNKIKVSFTGVISHHVEAVNEDSRVYAIEEIAIDEMYENLQSILVRAKLHNFPIKYKTQKSLETKLIELKINCYKIIPASGMFGLVFAKNMKLEKINA